MNLFRWYRSKKSGDLLKTLKERKDVVVVGIICTLLAAGDSAARLITNNSTIWGLILGLVASIVIASIVGPSMNGRLAVSWRWALAGLLLYAVGLFITAIVVFVVGIIALSQHGPA